MIYPESLRLLCRDITDRDVRATGLPLPGGAAVVATVGRRGRAAIRSAISSVSGRTTGKAQSRNGTQRDGSGSGGSGASGGLGTAPRMIPSGREGGEGEEEEAEEVGFNFGRNLAPAVPPTRPRSFPVTPAYYYEADPTPALAQVRNPKRCPSWGQAFDVFGGMRFDIDRDAI